MRLPFPWKAVATFTKAAKQGLSIGREILGANGKQIGRNEIVHGNVPEVLLVGSPGLEPYS